MKTHETTMIEEPTPAATSGLAGTRSAVLGARRVSPLCRLPGSGYYLFENDQWTPADSSEIERAYRVVIQTRADGSCSAAVYPGRFTR